MIGAGAFAHDQEDQLAGCATISTFRHRRLGIAVSRGIKSLNPLAAIDVYGMMCR
jgi:hypothetical protein